MSNSTVYLIAAYLGTALLYGLYLLWLRTQERRLEGGTGDTPR